ncbi:MAG: hypothetical protein AB1630_08255 [bacterium]
MQNAKLKMEIKNYNRRNKISTTLFDVIKYLLTIIVIGNILERFDLKGALAGFVLTIGIGIIAYFITPEEED